MAGEQDYLDLLAQQIQEKHLVLRTLRISDSRAYTSDLKSENGVENVA